MRCIVPGIVVILALFLVISGCTALQEWSNPALVLTKSQWKLSMYLDENGDLVRVGPGTAILINFSGNGNLAGFTGSCTRYTAAYSTTGEVISITGISRLPDPACTSPGASRAEEDYFFTLLPNVTRFNEENHELVLSYFDVKKMLIFTPV